MILQSAVLSHVPLVQGWADLVLLALIAWALQKRVTTGWHWAVTGTLMMAFVSALPAPVIVAGYGFAVGFSLWLRKRIWQVPALAMLLAVFLSTLVMHLVSLLALRLTGNPINFVQAIELITLPSMLLNLLLALPAFLIFGELAKWLYPETLEM